MDILDIKEQNLHLIINTVRFEDGITKKRLAHETGLSFATVSNLCNDLITQNVLVTKKNECLTVGRTPQNLYFNKNQFYTICLNLQLRGVIRLAVLNFQNEVIFSNKYNVDEINSAEEVVKFAHKKYKEDFLAELDNQNFTVIGIGVAVSAIFDIQTGKICNSSIDFFTDVPLKKIVEKEFGIPAYVDNEANLCAISAEAMHPQTGELVYLHISEGVGVGIIVGHKILQGINGYAGEVAHIPIGDNSVKCSSCGNYGCVEEELSINGILKDTFGKSSANKMEQWNQLITLLENGEKESLELARHKGILLGKLASVLINLFDPAVFIVGGDIAGIFKFCENSFYDELRKRCPVIVANKINIICDHDSENTLLFGLNQAICNRWLPIDVHSA